MNRYILSFICLCALPALAHGNQVLNGDFQTGALAPSTTAYSMSGDMIPPATWNIVTFDTLHPQWDDFYDHTHGDGDGFYMILNGTDSGAGPAWSQTVSVTPNSFYKFSGWFATLFNQSPASIEYRVFDGATPVATSAFFTPGNTGDWEIHNTIFNSGSATSLSIEIWDTNLQFGGNDYAIDDISLVPAVPEPATAAMALAIVALAPSLVSRRAGYRACRTA
jgi:hypothetical protein